MHKLALLLVCYKAGRKVQISPARELSFHLLVALVELTQEILVTL